MVWNIEIQRAATLLASIVLASVFLTGCVADSPRTHLTWDGFRDTPLGQQAAVSHHMTAQNSPAQSATFFDRPAAHSKSSWYTASSLPPVTTPSTQTSSDYDAAPNFVWPVAGHVISDFGKNGDGQRNDGINIAAPMGTPIRAAASGTVSYAGSEIKGYGNLILIKHADGYVTAYAHVESIVISRGDTVTKGQVIAYAGATGDVATPQLHFEIRHGVQPVDPRTMLLASNAS